MKALPFIPLTAFFACTPKHSLEEKLAPQANPAVVVPEFIVKRVTEQYKGNDVHAFYTKDQNDCVVEKRIEGNTGSAFYVGNDFTLLYTYFDCSTLPASLEHIEYSVPLPQELAVYEPFIRDPTDMVVEQYKETYHRDADGCLTRMEVLTGDHMIPQEEGGKVIDFTFSSEIVYDWVHYFLIARPEGVFKEVIGEIDKKAKPMMEDLTRLPGNPPILSSACRVGWGRTNLVPFLMQI